LPSARRTTCRLVILWVAASLLVAIPADRTAASECGTETIADLIGSGDVAQLSGSSRSGCHTRDRKVNLEPQPYFTHLIACSPNRQQAAAGLCSATPCSSQGRFFAFRTLHRPDGSSSPAGFQCITLGQASVAPGVSAAQVFAAVRRVRLPGGNIGAVPDHQGLANLPSYFHLAGASQPPVDLQVATATVHASFHPVVYRWSFGDGQRLETAGPGSRGVGSEVQVAFRRRGRYRVGVTVVWAAEAFLDGRRVGQVDDLTSQAQTTYPVAEVRAVLTG
jgi:PKD domain